jgi:hypothetical protein
MALIGGARACRAVGLAKAGSRTSIDFRNAVGLSGSMVNTADTRAEPLVPECATGKDRLASPDGTKGLNVRWVYRGSADVSALLVINQGAR